MPQSILDFADQLANEVKPVAKSLEQSLEEHQNQLRKNIRIQLRLKFWGGIPFPPLFALFIAFIMVPSSKLPSSLAPLSPLFLFLILVICFAIFILLLWFFGHQEKKLRLEVDLRSTSLQGLSLTLGHIHAACCYLELFKSIKAEFKGSPTLIKEIPSKNIISPNYPSYFFSSVQGTLALELVEKAIKDQETTLQAMFKTLKAALQTANLIPPSPLNPETSIAFQSLPAF